MHQLIQRGTHDSSTLIQPSLEIGKEDDEYEREANHVAEKVMRMSDEGGDENKMHTGGADIKMMTEGNEAKKMGEESGRIQKMSAQSMGGMTASKNVESGINNSKGGGESLEADLQDEMGSKMGSDFSGVKIHTDSNAAHMNKEVGAKAFTHGNDIYFNKNQYNPTSNTGKHLLAHELTHTVQQTGTIQRADEFDTKGLKGLPEEERKKMDVASSTISSFSAPLAQLFEFPKTGQWYPTATDTDPVRRDANYAIDHNIRHFNVIGYKYLEDGLKNVAYQLMRSADEAYHEPGQTAPHPPEQEFSRTMVLDFKSDHPSLAALTLPNDAPDTPENKEKKEAKKVFESTMVYRFSFNGSGTGRKIYIEGMGMNEKIGGDVAAGKALFLKQNIGFSFVNATGASVTQKSGEEPIVFKNWGGDAEYNLVYAALSNLPENILQTVSGIRFFRAVAGADDILPLRNATPTDPYTATTQAEYFQTEHAIVVYDVAVTSKALNVYGDANAGFSTSFEKTIAHEVGHAVDLTPLRKAGVAEKANADLLEGVKNTKFQESDNANLAYNNSIPLQQKANEDTFAAYKDYGVELNNALTATDNKLSSGVEVERNNVFAAKQAQYTTADPAGKKKINEELNALNLIETGGTTDPAGLKFGSTEVLPGGTVVNGYGDNWDVNTKRYRLRAYFANTVTILTNMSGATELLRLTNEWLDMMESYNLSVDFLEAFYSWYSGAITQHTAVPQKAVAIDKANAMVKLMENYEILKNQTTALKGTADTKSAEYQTAKTNYETAYSTYVTAKTTPKSQSGYKNIDTVTTTVDHGNTTTLHSFSMSEDESTPTAVTDLTQFRQAAKADFTTSSEIDRITAYSDKNWREFYAETFSLYYTDPGRLVALRPNVFNYFETKYDQWKGKYTQ